MKMIKVTNEYREEIYINIKYITYIENYEYLEGYSKIQTVDSSVAAKGTPEQIVAMIHEAEGDK